MTLEIMQYHLGGYAPRTKENASADATLAFALDFTTAGEVLTKSSAIKQGKLYIAIDLNKEITSKLIHGIVKELKSVSAKTLNIAGNGIYTLKAKYSQFAIDTLITSIIARINELYPIMSLRTGGQTGVDEASAKAGIALNIPTLIVAPKGWVMRDASGTDIADEVKFKARFTAKKEIRRTKQTILVLDGNNLAYRQSVVSELHTSTGIATSVIFSILRGLTSFINQFDAFSFVICWDTHRSRRRLQLFPGYKSGRRKERTIEEERWYNEFIAQIKMTRKVLDFLSMPQVSVDHVEADDLMAILGGVLSKKYEVILVSTDKDLLQCVRPNVSVYNPFKKKLFTYENCLETIGLTAEQYLFARALMGDKSDSIPGIRGVGEKTAFEIIKVLRIPNLEFLRQFISTSEKKKKVHDYIEKESDIIERNLKLMRLPMAFSDLDEEERKLVEGKVNADLLKCILLNRREINSEKFYSLMSKLELYSALSEKNLKLLNIKLI